MHAQNFHFALYTGPTNNHKNRNIAEEGLEPPAHGL